ncbi:MAG: hypothetical protein MR809_03185 [Rikenellaceae bacterium]|nr:hypothetical protein [Rikenellaceae bacterium]
MKKTNILFSAAFAVFVTVSCSKDIIDNKDTVQQPNLVPMTFSVAESVEETAPDSKTTLVIVDNKKTINWVANDKVGVFGVVGVPTINTTVNTNNQIFKAGSSGASTTLSGYVVDGDNRFYALYPYQNGVSLTFEGNENSATALLNNVTIPVQQKAVAGSFDPDAYLFASLSTNRTSFTFYTPCSLVGFQLNDPDVSKIKSIRLYGNNAGDVLASEKGQIKVYSAASIHVATDGKSNYVELVPDGSDKFQNFVQYYFVVLRSKLTNGITIYVEYEDGTVKQKSSNNVFDVSANNCVKSLGALEGTSFSKVAYSKAFELGYNVIVGGKVYSKNNTTTYSSLNATTETVNLNSAAYKAGLYFLKGANFTLSGSWNVANDVVLIGDTDGVKFNGDTRYNIYHNSKSLRIKNIDITIPNTNYCLLNNNTSTDATELVFDGCKISTACPLLYSLKKKGDTVENTCAVKTLILKDCDITLTGSANHIVNLGYAKASKIETVNISGCTITPSVAARVISLPAWVEGSTTAPSFVFNNNVLKSVIPSGQSIISFSGKMNSIEVKNNSGSIDVSKVADLSKTQYFINYSSLVEPIVYDNNEFSINKGQFSSTFYLYPGKTME